MPNPLQSFSPFARLPKELQIKIWTHSLEVPIVIPRIVRVNYNDATSLFTYNFTKPPALEVCRVSRDAALKFYQPLLPNSTHPFFFNPTVDFLHCKSLLHYHETDLDLRERAVLPFIDSNADISAIRFLLLDRKYWSHRQLTNFTSPIKELREFRNIETILLVAASIEQDIETLKSFLVHLGRVPHPRFEPDRRYAQEIEGDTSLPYATVPDFRLLGDGGTDDHHMLERCFGWHKETPNPALPGPQNYPFFFDEY
jgi:hypothetical protein